MAQSPSSSQPPYVLPTSPYASLTSLITVGDYATNATDWRFVGIPDGIGAFDNGDGTLSVLLNHELVGTDGAVRDHGFTGAFVDLITIDKATGLVLAGDDLIQAGGAFSYAPGTDSYVPQLNAWSRFCSGDLADVSAFYNASSGLGSIERIYLTGEESGPTGRAYGFVVTDYDTTDGTPARQAFELGAMGKYAWENVVAAPHAGDKTIVMGQDDSTPGQIYAYVGDKQATGSAIEKAGLTNGKLYGVKVPSLPFESNATTVPAGGLDFVLQEMGPNGDARNLSGAELEAESAAEGVTAFLRPEDGAFDPTNPDRFYFVTTNAVGSPSRLWALEFNNIEDPLAGGKLKLLLDGTEGQQMFDNMTVSADGKVWIEEDVGNNARLGKIWMYDPKADQLTEVAAHDPALFLSGAPQFLTQDEEASGILETTGLLGPEGVQTFLLDSQVHTRTNVPSDLVEMGQLMMLTYDAPVAADATIGGTNGADKLKGGAGYDKIDGDFGDDVLLGLGGDDFLIGGYGNDVAEGGAGRDIIEGGVGDDTLTGGDGDDALYGEVGDDNANGGAGDDLLVGGVGDDVLSGWTGNDVIEGGFGDDYLEGGAGDDVITGGNGYDRIVGGQGDDMLTGGFGGDLFEFTRVSGHDVITDFQSGLDHLKSADKAKVLSTTQIDYDGDSVLDSAVLHIQGGGSITLVGVLTVSATDFV